jgi:hypothetical protein
MVGVGALQGVATVVCRSSAVRPSERNYRGTMSVSGGLVAKRSIWRVSILKAKSLPILADSFRLPGCRRLGVGDMLTSHRLPAEVAEWQTQRIQNPPRLTPRVGSTPTFGNP